MRRSGRGPLGGGVPGIPRVPRSGRVAPVLAGALAVALVAACDITGVVEDGRHVATVTVDARTLLAAQSESGVASVLETAELTVSHPGGGTTEVRAALTAADPVAELEVELPGGVHRFEARVISNDGTVLFEGSRDADVQAQDFVVEIELRPVAGVLVVTPDSIRIPGGGQFIGDFTVENRGSDPLGWQVVEVEPSSTTCDPRCLRFRPEGGEIGPGASVTMLVEPLVSARGLYTVRVASTVGRLELEVFVDGPQAAPPP